MEAEEIQEIQEAIEEGTLDAKVEGIFKDSVGGKNPVYVTDSVDGVKIQFINSSNQETLEDFSSILDKISERLSDDEDDGEVHDPYSGNQIYWEIVDEGSDGTLIK